MIQQGQLKSKGENLMLIYKNGKIHEESKILDIILGGSFNKGPLA
jgi:hypothetical protein